MEIINCKYNTLPEQVQENKDNIIKLAKQISEINDFNFMGEWISNNEYKVNDIVTYNNSIYVVIQDIDNSTIPPSQDIQHFYLTITPPSESNPNLLINGDFRVNQRGQEVYDTEGFCVDRWYFKGVTHDTLQTNFNAKTKTFTMNNISAYNLPSFGLFQYIENSNVLLGKTVTLSVKLNGNLYSVTGNIAENYSENDQIASIKLESDEDLNYVSRLSLYWNNTLKMLQFQIMVHVKAGYEYSMQLSEAKLEIGSVATAFSPRPYAEELAMCQRYYQKLRVNDVQYCSNVNTIYPNINLIQTLRTRPTISVITYPSIRGNGGILGNVDNLTSDSLKDNILMCVTNASSLGVVTGQIYTVTNGEIIADAEIY